MNKKNLWFLTLFSLVIVLSIYYVTMPEDLLAATTSSITTKNTNEKEVNMEVEESDTITTLKIEDTKETNDTLSDLQEQLTKKESTTEEKNNIYEQIKILNTNSGLEETIEKKIAEKYSCETFTKIENNTVKVVVDKCENSKTLANNIMRLVQEQFDNKMYISVQFET